VVSSEYFIRSDNFNPSTSTRQLQSATSFLPRLCRWQLIYRRLKQTDISLQTGIFTRSFHTRAYVGFRHR